MTSLLLIPLDDTVVFPTMDVTLPVDVGDEERVLLVPRHDGEYAKVGTIADGHRHASACPAAAAASQLSGRRPRHRRRRPHRPAGPPARRGHRARRRRPRSTAAPASSSASTARSSRRSSSCAATTAASRSSCARSPSPGPLADTLRLLARPDLRAEGPAARDARRHRAPRARPRASSASAWPSCRCAASIREDVEPAPRSSSASTSCASRWSRSAGSSARTTRSVVEEYRTKIDEAGMPEAVREQAEQGARPPRAHGRAVGRGADDPHLPRLADRRAVGEALRGEARPGRTPARCSTPTTPASRTSRTASSSTSPCEAARGARDRATTSAPARS